MNDLFGLSMNLIMWVLLGALGVALSVVLYVILRSRVMFFIGIRNMPRRIAQTTLIIIGLMLSTLIISAAFTTGDTVDRSLTAQMYRLLGHADAWVMSSVEEESAPNQIDTPISDTSVERLRASLDAEGDPSIDGFLPILRESVPVVNPRAGQSEPSINFVGLDTSSLEGFPDLIAVDGGAQLDVAVLAPDEVYMNDSAADDLAAEPGDRIQVFVQGQLHEFTVVNIVEDNLLSGVGDFDKKSGMTSRLDTLQALFDRPGEVNFIAISNEGGVREGLDHMDAAMAALDRAFIDAGLSSTLDRYDVKRDLVDGAKEAGNFMTTFFVAFGLFSIAAGMLLIVMIFVMLAAERKSELGMARAVGTRRGHLIQMFMSEGMAYNVLAAMVGVGLGVLVAVGIANIMGRIFGDFFQIEPHVTARSLVVSYSLGVVLTFITVTFASWRASNLNIVAAIRDLPETNTPNPEAGTMRGYLRGLLNATVLITTAPVGPLVLMLRGHPISFPAHERQYPERVPIWPFVVLPLAPFYLVAIAVVWQTRDRRPSSVPALAVLAGILLPPVGLVLVALQERRAAISWSAGFATVGVGLGMLLVVVGLASNLAFPFALGFSLGVFGLAVLLTFFGLNDRAVYTGTGLFLLLFWGLTAGNRLEFLFGVLEGDIEMFFLSGIVMVAASTFVLVYNSDLVLALVSRAGGSFGTILPALKTAIAYPLESRFRTGMTLAMISLVIFALTMMSTMNFNFDRLFLDDSARGGWDVVVDENPNNPVDDLSSALAANGSGVSEEFRAVGRMALPPEPRVVENVAGAGSEIYPVFGVDASFAQNGTIPLSARATGYESEADVWNALATEDNVAVVDRFTVESGGFGGDGGVSISGIDPEDNVFDPVSITVLDGISQRRATVRVIGVIEFGASASFFGVYIPASTFDEVYGEPLLTRHLVGLNDPGQSKDVARQIEASLLTLGAQAESLKQQIDDDQALFRNFFLLMQGFMGLGLLVGIAAVGVIAFRTVVERRQQIGMLRAIGYQRSTVSLSFLLESSFITLLGIASGIGLGIWLSFFLITSNEFPTSDVGYAIPWQRILLIGGLTFVASLVMTYIPSRQAASVPIAEALRYE